MLMIVEVYRDLRIQTQWKPWRDRTLEALRISLSTNPGVCLWRHCSRESCCPDQRNARTMERQTHSESSNQMVTIIIFVCNWEDSLNHLSIVLYLHIYIAPLKPIRGALRERE